MERLFIVLAVACVICEKIIIKEELMTFSVKLVQKYNKTRRTGQTCFSF